MNILRRLFARPVTRKGTQDSTSINQLSAVSTNETDSGFLLAEGFGLIAVT